MDLDRLSSDGRDRRRVRLQGVLLQKVGNSCRLLHTYGQDAQSAVGFEYRVRNVSQVEVTATSCHCQNIVDGNLGFFDIGVVEFAVVNNYDGRALQGLFENRQRT